MNIYDELVERGLIAQTTNEEEIKKLVNEGKAVFYIGFDPTADSLHVGHFMALCLMKRLQEAGNKPVVLVGGGTGMIGDPSGRTDLRKVLTKETIEHNVECFKKQMSRFIDFSEGKAIIVNNADWLLGINYVDFLRDIGPHFSVNRMLTAECYKQRMEQGLTFLEFNYMLMQAYDFYHLFQKYGCNMQFGGDDQWSNMLAGTELIRRKLGKDSHAMTITLLTNSEGKKMGKTSNGAVWLDPNKTSPFEFYQYWRNVDDADVIKCIKLLTFLPLDKIKEMEKWEGSELNKAKEILAYELTSLVHGEEEAKKCQETAHNLFSGQISSENMPSLELKESDLQDGKIELAEALVKGKLCTSKGDARRNIEQGGVSVNDNKITDVKHTLSKDNLKEGIVIKRGKKNFIKLFLTSIFISILFVSNVFATTNEINVQSTNETINENANNQSNDIKNFDISNETIDDKLKINILDTSKATEFDSLIDPYTNSNVSGYLINDCNYCSVNFANPTTPNTNIHIKQYYLETTKDHDIAKIMIKETQTLPSIPIEMIPSHVKSKLKNDKNKKNKLFVIEASYHTNENDVSKDKIKKQIFYYSYLDKDDYDAYVEMKNSKVKKVN